MLDDITQELIASQDAFDWTAVKFPVLVKSINWDILQVAYFYEKNESGYGELFGGYHCSYTEDKIGLSSNFVIVNTLL